MVSFETFREYLLWQLAEMLNINIEGLNAWEIWLAVHERCPEAARIASDQWIRKELLEEHRRFVKFVHDQDYDWLASQQLCKRNYMYRWRYLQTQLLLAIVKQKKAELDCR
jgi:hypothetical protein